MHALFRKELANGIVTSYIDLEWDVLKAKLAQIAKTDDIPIKAFDMHFGWDNLRNGYIINDGATLWCYWNDQKNAMRYDLFEGQIVFLEEIDPIFEH
jgi:hypothetical protein